MFDALIIDQCKHKEVPTELVLQIIKIESSSNPYALNINTKDSPPKAIIPSSKEEAFTIAQKYINEGHSVDIGLMQINSKNLGANTIIDVLDPCTNITLGSSIYHSFYKATPAQDDDKTRIQKALSAYNTGSFTNGFKNGYVQKYFPKTPSALTPEQIKKYAKHLLSIRFPSELVASAHKR